MTVMIETDSRLQLATTIKPCPCCASRGVVTQAAGQPRYGVRCTGCALTFPEVYDTPETAVSAWCQRRGGVSAAGGRATKGLSTWRKRRSCRRNLRIARRKKKLKWIRTRVDVIVSWLKKLRSVELAEVEAAIAEDRAWLKERQHLILTDPLLRSVYELLLSRNDSIKHDDTKSCGNLGP